MSQQMYAFEPQTFADSGFSLRALRVLSGKYAFLVPDFMLLSVYSIRQESSGGGSRGGTRLPRNCAVWAYLLRQLRLAVCLYSIGLLS